MSFPITCTACHKTFTVSDEIYEKKVAGRVVTIKCKSCGQGIRVDGLKGAAAAVASSPPAATVDPVVPTEPLWAVDYPDGQDREFTTREVIAELERGVVTGQTLVWRDGMAEWLELAQVAELAPELAKIEAKKKAEAEAKAKAEAEAAAKAKAEAAKAKAEAAAKAKADAAAKAKAAPAAMHQPRAPMPTVSGLGGSGGATATKAKPLSGASPGVKPRAPLGSSPRSPLGSSPELTSKESVSASQEITPRVPAVHVPAAAIPPALVAPPAPVVAFPEPSVTPVPTPVLRPVPVELPTPPLPASVAKVVSKPPEVPAALPSFPMSTSPAPTFGNLPAVVADHASVEWPETKKKSRAILLGLVAAAVALGGLVFALSRKDELPPPTPISALPSPPGAPTSAPTPATSPTMTSTNRPGDETASGSDPVIATPGAGFAELFAAGARKAESKGATVAPTARFDPASTKAPLAQAATDAQACKQSGGPSGKVTVVVTFDPNGKAAGATITDAPFAGTPTGSCIVAAMKRAVIPPFSGLPGTVSKTFTLL